MSKTFAESLETYPHPMRLDEKHESTQCLVLHYFLLIYYQPRFPLVRSPLVVSSCAVVIKDTSLFAQKNTILTLATYFMK